jgi:hypothetical protein
MLVMAKPKVNAAKPGQRQRFALAIADLEGDIQGLPVLVGRFLVPALVLPDEPEVAVRAGFDETVAKVTGDGDGFLLMADGLLVMAQLRLDKADVHQRACLAGTVARGTVQCQRPPVAVTGLLKAA